MPYNRVMEILDLARSFAESSSYEFQRTLDGHYAVALTETNNDRSRRESMISGMQRSRFSFIDKMRTEVDRLSLKIDAEALRDAGVDSTSQQTEETFLTHHATMRSVYIQNIETVSSRMMNIYIEAYDRHMLQAYMISRAKNVSMPVARTSLFGSSMIYSDVKPNDISGRKVPITNQITLLTRHLILTGYNDRLVYEISRAGESEAMVIGQQGHKHTGLTFSITYGDDGYNRIRSEIFHPNSSYLAGRM